MKYITLEDIDEIAGTDIVLDSGMDPNQDTLQAAPIRRSPAPALLLAGLVRVM